MKPKHKQPGAVSELVFFSYPKLLYCWPLIALGPLLYPLAVGDPGPARLEVLGWIYLLVAVVVVITMDPTPMDAKALGLDPGKPRGALPCRHPRRGRPFLSPVWILRLQYPR